MTQIDNDYELVMRLFSRHKKRTAKQLREAIEIPVVRAEAAIARLEERGRIKNISGSGSTTAYALAE